MSAYTYDPRTGTFIIPSSTMSRMLRRIAATKERCAAEDERENEAKLRALRATEGKR